MIYIEKNFKMNEKYLVYNIFNNVINLEKDGKIYSIIKEKVGKAPFSMIVDDIQFTYYLEKARKLNELYIDYIENKIIFSSILKKKIINKNINLLKDYINDFERQDSIIEKEFQKRRKEKNLIEMIGLGHGLTPSGDDYIVGIMVAYYVQNDKIPYIFKKIVEMAHKKTNLISYNYILNAYNRLFKEEIIDLIYDLENREKIEKLISFGSSSGQDIIYGIYDYLSGNIKI